MNLPTLDLFKYFSPSNSRTNMTSWPIVLIYIDSKIGSKKAETVKTVVHRIFKDS